MILPAASLFLDINNDSNALNVQFSSIETYLSNQGKRFNVKKSSHFIKMGKWFKLLYANSVLTQPMLMYHKAFEAVFFSDCYHID